MKFMEDELLADILAVERDIRLQIDARKQQSAERLAALEQELEQQLATETATLEAARTRLEAAAVEAAAAQAEALLASAREYAMKLDKLDGKALAGVVLPRLARLLPEGAYDSHHEQT
jgi:hypothetical protein